MFAPYAFPTITRYRDFRQRITAYCCVLKYLVCGTTCCIKLCVHLISCCLAPSISEEWPRSVVLVLFEIRKQCSTSLPLYIFASYKETQSTATKEAEGYITTAQSWVLYIKYCFRVV
jgi:hypothetical protein